MRTDPNELPTRREGETDSYPADELRSRASATATRAFPHIEAVCALMGRLRAADTRLNPQIGMPSDAFYGPPKLVVVDEGFDVSHERPWDHTAYALEEAAEIAQRLGGVVLVEQDIYVPTWPNPETGWIDEGFSIEVWPRFHVRY